MLDGLSLPQICATNLKEIIRHPFLREDEKILWLWLATHCTNHSPFTCSFTYEQIAHAVNKPTRGIHRILFRLKIMGLLQGDIPIWYGKLTISMVHEMRTIKLVLPLKAIDKKFFNETILPPRSQRRINLNLLF